MTPQEIEQLKRDVTRGFRENAERYSRDAAVLTAVFVTVAAISVALLAALVTVG
jgi:hypothetical protein